MDTEYKHTVIKVPDNNDNLLSFVIDNTRYWLRMTWNHNGQYWKFGLYDANKEAIYTAMRVIPNFPVNVFLNFEDTPKGVFVVKTKKEKIGRQSFVNNEAQLCYFPVEDI